MWPLHSSWTFFFSLRQSVGWGGCCHGTRLLRKWKLPTKRLFVSWGARLEIGLSLYFFFLSRTAKLYSSLVPYKWQRDGLMLVLQEHGGTIHFNVVYALFQIRNHMTQWNRNFIVCIATKLWVYLLCFLFLFLQAGRMKKHILWQ